MTGRDLLKALGTGPGFAGFAYVVVLGLYVLTWFGHNVSPLSGPLGIIVGAYYGGGVGKRWFETRRPPNAVATQPPA